MRAAVLHATLALASMVLIGCSSNDAGGDTAGSTTTVAESTTATSVADVVSPGGLRTATGALDGPRDERIGPPANARPIADPTLVRDGVCLNEFLVEGANGSNQAQLAESSCDEPHDAEVFATLLMAQSEVPLPPGADRPSDRDLHRGASALCLERFEDFVGRAYTTSALAVSVLRPTPMTWEANDRAIACSVYDSEFTPLTGTMRNSRR